jgi:hypothetical protein
VSVPARQIAEIFGFGKTFWTEFDTDEHGRINGIKCDTFGNLKVRFVSKKPNAKITYYTDDVRTEYKMKKVADTLLKVKPR